MLLAANRPSVYVVGTLLYLITEGLCWARFVALVLEVVRRDTRDAGTWYSLLVAAGAVSQTYMTWLDGAGYRAFGTHGLLWTDAGGNLLVFGATVAVFVLLGLRIRPVSAAAGNNPQRSA